MAPESGGISYGGLVSRPVVQERRKEVREHRETQDMRDLIDIVTILKMSHKL